MLRAVLKTEREREREKKRKRERKKERKRKKEKSIHVLWDNFISQISYQPNKYIIGGLRRKWKRGNGEKTF